MASFSIKSTVLFVITCIGLALACQFNKRANNDDVQKSNKKLEAIPASLPDIETPDDALNLLKAGNERFLNGQFEHIHIKRITTDSEKNKQPFVAILTCTDCKIPPEIIFDQEHKNVMVMRTPGNIEDVYVLKNLDSTIQQKDMRLILILGHDHCRAIQSAIIHPAEQYDTRAINAAGKKQVKNTISRIILKDKLVDSMIHVKKIEIMGAFYDAKSGKVSYNNEF